jgi:hypothetical protein
MSQTDHRCPCGKSTYTVVSLMDDWNRTEERWTMNCRQCQTTHALHTFWYPDSGMTVESKRWVQRAALESFQQSVLVLVRDVAKNRL